MPALFDHKDTITYSESYKIWNNYQICQYLISKSFPSQISSSNPLVGCPIKDFCEFALTELHTPVWYIVEWGEQAALK